DEPDEQAVLPHPVRHAHLGRLRQWTTGHAEGMVGHAQTLLLRLPRQPAATATGWLPPYNGRRRERFTQRHGGADSWQGCFQRPPRHLRLPPSGRRARSVVSACSPNTPRSILLPLRGLLIPPAMTTVPPGPTASRKRTPRPRGLPWPPSFG